jgi:glycosyltransferase involved in cell wall biosynthesis
MAKILYFTFLFDPKLGGGASSVVNLLADSFSEKGHKVIIVSSKNKGLSSSRIIGKKKLIEFFPFNLYWIYEKENQPVIKKIIWQLIDIWNPFVYSFVRKIIKTESPDIIHSHKLRGLSPSIWNASTYSDKAKIIHTSHDFELISPQGLLEGKIGKMASQSNFPINIYQNIRAHSSKLVNNFTSPSQFLLSKHIDTGFFSNARNNVIPNSHGFTEKELKSNFKLMNNNNQNLKLLFIGRLVKEKGILLLCDAIRQFIYENKPIQLDIIGWGSLETELINTYTTDEFVFHGPLYNEDKNQLIANCDMLVMPSIVPESFGLVIAEAFSFGKPVLAANIGAIPELVIEDWNGFLFNPGDINDLINKLKYIFSQKSNLKNFSKNCYISAQKYTIDEFIRNYQTIYF